MLNLANKIGLLATLSDINRLDFNSDVTVGEIRQRSFEELKPVLYDPDTDLPPDPAYLMYRDVRKIADNEKLTTSGLRFDLTTVPPAKVGNEYVKTLGHYHPKNQAGVAYPEIYFAVLGSATYILQKKEEGGTISDIIICRVKAGESIIIPPLYGHVTVNETDETLVMANWIHNDFQSLYEDYEQMKGAAYYIVSENGSSKVIKNEAYTGAPGIREMIVNPAVNASKRLPYDLIDILASLDFLKNPENYLPNLTVDNLFVPKI